MRAGVRFRRGCPPARFRIHAGPRAARLPDAPAADPIADGAEWAGNPAARQSIRHGWPEWRGSGAAGSHSAAGGARPQVAAWSPAEAGAAMTLSNGPVSVSGLGAWVQTSPPWVASCRRNDLALACAEAAAAGLCVRRATPRRSQPPRMPPGEGRAVRAVLCRAFSLAVSGAGAGRGPCGTAMAARRAVAAKPLACASAGSLPDRNAACRGRWPGARPHPSDGAARRRRAEPRSRARSGHGLPAEQTWDRATRAAGRARRQGGSAPPPPARRRAPPPPMR